MAKKLCTNMSDDILMTNEDASQVGQEKMKVDETLVLFNEAAGGGGDSKDQPSSKVIEAVGGKIDTKDVVKTYKKKKHHLDLELQMKSLLISDEAKELLERKYNGRNEVDPFSWLTESPRPVKEMPLSEKKKLELTALFDEALGVSRATLSYEETINRAHTMLMCDEAIGGAHATMEYEETVDRDLIFDEAAGKNDDQIIRARQTTIEIEVSKHRSRNGWE